MGLESVNHISDLDDKNPLAGDNVSQGDDHIRNIKKALLTDFPNINAAVSATPAQLDYTTVTTLGTAEASKAMTASAASTMTFNGMTIADLGTVTTADINGGTVDGTVIGNSSAAAISGTTLSASSSLVLAAGATVTAFETTSTNSATKVPTSSAMETLVAAQIAANSLLASSTSSTAGHIEFEVSTGVGIMVAWGTDVASGGGSATFEKAFSATPWVVVVGAHDTAGGATAATASLDSYNSTGLSYGSTAPVDNIHYIAIGPTTP